MATDSSNGGIMIKPEVLDGRTGLSEEARHAVRVWTGVQSPAAAAVGIHPIATVLQ